MKPTEKFNIQKELKEVQSVKTFYDLEFVSNPSMKRARMTFDNEYGISVMKGIGTYGYKQNLWEVAVFHKGSICYNTHITDDVLGYQTESDVTNVMKLIQEL